MYRVSLHFPPFYLNTCLCELPSVRRWPAGPSRAAHVRRWQQSRTLRSTPALGCAGLLPAGRGRALPSPPEKGPRPHPPEGGAYHAPPTGRRRTPRPAYRKESPAPPSLAMADRLTQLQDAVNSVRRLLPFFSATVLLPAREGSWPGLVLFLPARCGLRVASPPDDPSQGTLATAAPS